MYKSILFFGFFFALQFSQAQQCVQLKSGLLCNTNEPFNLNAINNPDYNFEGRTYTILQFNELPTIEQQNQLKSVGIQLYKYYPTNSYMGCIPINPNIQTLKQFGIVGIMGLPPAFKIDNQIYALQNIPWAVNGNNIRVVVSFIPTVSKQKIKEIFLQSDIIFSSSEIPLTDAIEVNASISEIKKMAQHPLVLYIEPIDAPATLEDEQGISNHRNNVINTTDNYTLGKKYNGRGVTVVMGDDGFVKPHLDFTGRLINRATDTATASNHGDHVLGIIGGSNNFNSAVKGQSPSSKLITYQWYDDYSAYPSMYNTDSARVTSHSLGQTCNSGYTSNARTSDQLINTYPLINHVHSAGNSGGSTCGGLTGGWATITGGYKAAKNTIAVANLLKDDTPSSSSSKGPSLDGRIKPDIAAVGSNVNSTQPTNTYGFKSGTSMAAPAIAGSLAVLAQAYKTNFAQEAPAALLKAIAMNTADDLGNIGPDFTYGFGRINMRRAINCIEAGLFLNNTVSQTISKTHSIIIPSNVAIAKIMVYWNDVEATAGVSKPLVNNLNASLTNPTNTSTFLPWVLTAGTPFSISQITTPAINGVDTINNVEQIQLSNPTAGNYTLTVTGSTVPIGSQQYFVVIEYIYRNELVVTYPFGGETVEPGSTQRIRWDALSQSPKTFRIDYSLNNGGSWTTIGSANFDRRFIDWTVPSTTSASARVRVVYDNEFIDMSDTTFVILARPTNVNFTTVCNGRSTISWNAVSGATGYDVFRLGATTMDLIASTNGTTSITLNNLGNAPNWYSVRAKMANRGAFGIRTNAVAHTNSSSLACPPLPVKLTHFYGKISNGKPVLIWNVNFEENMTAYEIERSSSPNFENIELVSTIKPKNKGALSIDYEVVDNERLTEATYYYRLKMIEIDKATFSRIVPINLTSKIKTEFSLYPNPTLNDLYITNATNVVANISIYNLQGQLLQSQNNVSLQKNVGFRVAVNNLSSGIYFLVITNEKSGEILGKQLFNKQ